jgi:hypothetical protein
MRRAHWLTFGSCLRGLRTPSHCRRRASSQLAGLGRYRRRRILLKGSPQVHNVSTRATYPLVAEGDIVDAILRPRRTSAGIANGSQCDHNDDQSGAGQCGTRPGPAGACRSNWSGSHRCPAASDLRSRIRVRRRDHVDPVILASATSAGWQPGIVGRVATGQQRAWTPELSA